MSDEANSYVDMDQYADVDPDKALDPEKFQNLKALLDAGEPEINDATWDGMLEVAVDPQSPQVEESLVPDDVPYQDELDDDDLGAFGAGDLSSGRADSDDLDMDLGFALDEDVDSEPEDFDVSVRTFEPVDESDDLDTDMVPEVTVEDDGFDEPDHDLDLGE